MAQALLEERENADEGSTKQASANENAENAGLRQRASPGTLVTKEDSVGMQPNTVTPKDAESTAAKTHWKKDESHRVTSQVVVEEDDEPLSPQPQDLPTDGSVPQHEWPSNQTETSRPPEDEASTGNKQYAYDTSEEEIPAAPPPTLYERRETVSCPQSLVGRLIGKQGETIKELQRRSRARIQIDQNFPEGQPRLVTIEGEVHSVQVGVELVTNLIGNSPAVGNGAPGQLTSFECPKSLVGRVIGKGGETINELQRRSGARIQIEQRVPEGAPCIIEVQGDDAAVTEAIRLTHDVMRGTRLDMSATGPMAGTMLITHTGLIAHTQTGAPIGITYSASPTAAHQQRHHIPSGVTGIHQTGVQRTSSQDVRSSPRSSPGSHQDRRHSTGAPITYATHQQHLYMPPQYQPYYQQAGYAYPGYPIAYGSVPYSAYAAYPALPWYAGAQQQQQPQQQQHLAQNPSVQQMSTPGGSNPNVAAPAPSIGRASSATNLNQTFQSTSGVTSPQGLSMSQQQQQSVQHSQHSNVIPGAATQAANTGAQQMITTGGNTKPRQDGWSSHNDGQGRTYWYNQFTGESTWNAPPGV